MEALGPFAPFIRSPDRLLGQLTTLFYSGGAGGRIDFLFYNAAATSSHGHTVTYNEADAADVQFTGTDRDDLNYSGHRAMSARIYY